jgi:hypothetical protein
LSLSLVGYILKPPINAGELTMVKWEYWSITGIYYDTKADWLLTDFHRRSLMLFKDAYVCWERIERGNPNELSKFSTKQGEKNEIWWGVVRSLEVITTPCISKRSKDYVVRGWSFVVSVEIGFWSKKYINIGLDTEV